MTKTIYWKFVEHRTSFLCWLFGNRIATWIIVRFRFATSGFDPELPIFQHKPNCRHHNGFALYYGETRCGICGALQKDEARGG